MQSTQKIKKGAIEDYISNSAATALLGKLSTGGYTGTAQDLRNEIASILANVRFLGDVTTTTVISGEVGNIYTIVTEPGTYTNWGGIVVPVNTYAVLKRVEGLFSSSQTGLDLSAYTKLTELDSVIENAVKSLNKNLIYKGRVNSSSATPTATFNHTYLATATGTVLGIAVTNGDLLVGNGSVFEIRQLLAPTMERVVLSDNLLDKSDLLFESIVHNSDNITISTTKRSTNFIKVTPNKNYYFRQASVYRHAIIGFTDKSNNTSVGRIGSASTFGAYSFVMPENVNFVKVGLVGSGETLDENLFSQFSLSHGDYLDNTNMVYSGFYLNETLQNLAFNIKSGSLKNVLTKQIASSNLLNYDKILKGLRVDNGLDKLYPASGFSMSEIIPCVKNEPFVFAGISDFFERRALFYNENGAPIAGAISYSSSDYKIFEGSVAASEGHLKIVIPDNDLIKGFRMTIHASDANYTDRKSKYHIFRGTEYKEFSNYRTTQQLDGFELNPKQDIVQEMAKPLIKRNVDFSNKTIAFIGDSITSNNIWVSYFLRNIRPKKSYNYSAGGARLVNTNGTVNPEAYENSGCDRAHRMVADYNSGAILMPDYVLICLGTNEFGKTPDTSVLEANIDNEFTSGGVTLKSLSSVDITKINGAMRYMIETMATVFTTTKFLFVTPIPNTQNGWTSQKNVVDTIKWTARRLSIPIIDLHGSSNIITLFDYPAGVSTYRNLVDGTHPFGTGVVKTPATKMIAEQVASGFLNYVLDSK